MNPTLQKRTIEILGRAFADLQAIYLFGSQASGNARHDSDWDFGILLPKSVGPEPFWAVANDVAKVLGGPVDLVDLRRASTVMQHQVVTTGKRLWSSGSQADFFECFVLAEKTSLDAARAPYIRDILQRGHVYGR